MNTPKELLYTKSHEWVLFTEDGCARIGLTDYAQSSLGDLVFVNLPQEGDNLTKEEAFADVESVKAVSDVFSPVTGVVSKVNEALMDAPEMINQSPYEAWLIEASDISEKEELLSADDYEKVVAQEQD